MTPARGAEAGRLSDPAGADSPGQPTRGTGTGDVLIFDNGDMLYGSLQSIDRQRRIQWDRPDALHPFEFRSDQVVEIQLEPRAVTEAERPINCRVRLSNQDEFKGDLVAVDADHVALDTRYAGRINLARSSVQFIVPIPARQPPLFTGPAGLEGWTLGEVKAPGIQAGQWRYEDGAFSATNAASIARDVGLPAVASIQFDLAWKGILYLAVALYTDYLQPISLSAKENEPPFGGFYSLQLNSFSANVLPVKQQEPLRYLEQVPVSAFSQKKQARVEVRADKHRHLIALLVDGQLLKQWVDPRGFVGEGTGIRLVHQGQGAIRFSHLRVTEWDGLFEQAPTPTRHLVQDLVRLRNGDQVMGRLQTIRDHAATVQLADRSLAIPLDRIGQIELAGSGSGTDREADVRAFFHDGGSVTFRLEAWAPQGVVGRSAHFGQTRFDPRAFSRLLLNLERADQ